MFYKYKVLKAKKLMIFDKDNVVNYRFTTLNPNMSTDSKKIMTLG